MNLNNQRYPKPKEQGGRIIRKVIGLLKEAKFEVPLTSHILIACSAGSDSIALAHLLIKYGRRVAPKAQLSLLHVNHGWRGQESDEDEKFVRDFAARYNVPFINKKLNQNWKNAHGRSLEEWARTERKKVFAELTSKKTLIMTAHHADDLAETLIWRLFRGEWDSHQQGILLKAQNEIRPFLKIRKRELLAYLSEENQEFRMDSSNQNTRFLRNEMRAEILPKIEKVFPKYVDHLVEYGLAAQKRVRNKSKTRFKNEPIHSLRVFLNTQGMRLKKAHIRAEKAGLPIDLPGGWRLVKKSEKTKLI